MDYWLKLGMYARHYLNNPTFRSLLNMHKAHKLFDKSVLAGLIILIFKFAFL